MKQRNSDNWDGRIPLIVGVTGHRDIDPSDECLRGAVRAELRSLRERFPNTPFLVISPLAEGADRILTALALETLNARLMVVLPLPRDEYERDFQKSESLSGFKELLAKADETIVVPQEHTTAEVAVNKDARNHQYAMVGAWIVEHSQVLVAIWNGRPARGYGGTGDVMHWRRQNAVPHTLSSLHGCSLLAEGFCGLTISIDPESKAITRFAAPQTYPEAERLLGSMDAFNKDVSKRPQNERQKGVAAFPRCPVGQGSQPEFEPGSSVAGLWRWHGVTDWLANDFQRRAGRLVLTVTWCLFLALVFQQLGRPFGDKTVLHYGLWIYTAFGLFFLILQYVVRKRRLEDRYLEYRALAEGLRVALGWKVAGVNRRVSTAFSAEHAGSLSWIREAYRSIETVMEPGGQFACSVETALRWWVEPQTEYFTRKAAVFRKRAKLFMRIVTLGTSASMLISLAGLALKSHLPSFWAFVPALASGTILILVALAKYYDQKKAYSALANYYDLHQRLFRRATELIRADPERGQKVLVELGDEVLNETSLWLKTNRQVPIKPAT